MCGREVLAGLYLSGLSTKPVRALPGHVIFLTKMSPSSGEATCLVLSSLCFIGERKWSGAWDEGRLCEPRTLILQTRRLAESREDMAYEQQPCTLPRLPPGSRERFQTCPEKSAQGHWDSPEISIGCAKDAGNMNRCLCFSFHAHKASKGGGEGASALKHNPSLLEFDTLQTRPSQTLCSSPSFQVLNIKTMRLVFHILKTTRFGSCVKKKKTNKPETCTLTFWSFIYFLRKKESVTGDMN